MTTSADLDPSGATRPEPSFDATILLRSEQTDGALSAIALTVPAAWSGPPLPSDRLRHVTATSRSDDSSVTNR